MESCLCSCVRPCTSIERKGRVGRQGGGRQSWVRLACRVQHSALGASPPTTALAPSGRGGLGLGRAGTRALSPSSHHKHWWPHGTRGKLPSLQKRMWQSGLRSHPCREAHTRTQHWCSSLPDQTIGPSSISPLGRFFYAQFRAVKVQIKSLTCLGFLLLSMCIRVRIEVDESVRACVCAILYVCVFS